MRIYTRWVHTIVRLLKIENLFIVFGKSVSIFIKALPLPTEYVAGNFLTIKRDHTFFTIDRSDYMQWYLYANLPDSSWVKAFSILKSGSIILDIGANCGQFSLKLANALKNVEDDQFVIHAFEPNPDIFNLLIANLKLNPEINRHVHCHPIALGKESGELGFNYNPANSGGGSISIEKNNDIVVKVQKLDIVVESLSLSRIDFIKIDVEGFEPEVILGGEKTITSFRPWIYIEITPTWFQARGHSTNEIIKKFLSWDYELYGEYNQKFVSYLENEQQFRSLHQFNLLAKPYKK